MILTKEIVEKTKKEGEEAIRSLIANFETDATKINFILESLGSLPKDFKGDWLFNYTNHSNHKLRMSAVKNIGKLKLNDNIDELYKLFNTETKTEIRREIISSVGRQRNKDAKEFLIKTLQDDDPKVVSQAIRALLVFRVDEDIAKELMNLRNHKNEMISAVIEKEFFAKEIPKSKIHHTETYEYLKNTVVHGDVLEVLKYVPEDSVHLTFTSPPYYNARDYSIYPSYIDYLNFLDATFKEVHRVTKEGRFLLINTSPVIMPRIGRQYSSKRFPIPFDLHNLIVNSGWEYIDDIIWLKSEASVKNRVGGFQQHRKPLGYKPNTITEMIMVYRKKTTKLLDWNIAQYPRNIVDNSRVSDGFETSNVWKIEPTYSKKHTAVFPAELCKRVIEYYSFQGDLVFDPFGGSGTLAKVAKSLKRLFFLTELNDEYFEHMKTTLNSTSLFNETDTNFLDLEHFKNLKNETNTH